MDRSKSKRVRQNTGTVVPTVPLKSSAVPEKIRRCEAQRRSMCKPVNVREASVKTVLEFLRLLRRGLDIGTVNSWVMDMNTSPASRSCRRDQQLAFVNAFVAPDVRVDDIRGRDGFIEQTKRFSAYFDGFEILSSVVENVVIGPDGTTVVHMHVELEFTISLTTIRQVFPHLTTCLKLKWTLQGHRMRCCVTMFYMLDDKHTIIGTDGTVDFAAGFAIHPVNRRGWFYPPGRQDPARCPAVGHR